MGRSDPGRVSPRALAWLRSGLLDPQFYGDLRGRSFDSAEQAAEDFVAHGMTQRLSPHPDLDVVSLPADAQRALRRGQPRQLIALLEGPDGVLSPPAGPLDRAQDRRATRSHLRDVARQLGEEARGVVPRPDVPPGVGDRPGMSVVVLAGRARLTALTVESLLQCADEVEGGVEVLLVDAGSPPAIALHLQALFHERPQVRMVRVAADTAAGACVSLGVENARGPVLAIVAPGVVVRRHVLDALVAALDAPEVAAVQPVVTGLDDMVLSAGVVVRDGGRFPLLAGHPREDAYRLRDHDQDSLSGYMVALGAEAAGPVPPDPDLDGVVASLCGRLSVLGRGVLRTVPSAVVTFRGSPAEGHGSAVAADPGLHEELGFEVDRRPGPGSVLTGVRKAAPGALRWTLQLPSWPGRPGDTWGDTHFAEAFAGALRELGQEVVTRRRGADRAGPTHLDDVAVAIRGLYPIAPLPGCRNVLWVISHPDDVSREELDGYDVVVAASTTWSAEKTREWGRPVVPLLQATSFTVPEQRDARDPLAHEARAVFVGNNGAARERPLVWAAVEAGIPLTVYGRGWEDLPPGTWQGEYIDNSELPTLYRDHGVVLADHWPDMAAQGFVANRVFDARASGAGVICDDVAGVHEVFEPDEVVVARGTAEVARAFERLAVRPGPSRASLSFSARARELLEMVRVSP